ncbi:hypothetical protein FQN60_002363, partial [Etheostoma spectabile]
KNCFLRAWEITRRFFNGCFPHDFEWNFFLSASNTLPLGFKQLLLLLLFRANIDEVETEVVEIEAKLDKLVKLCSGMIEAGKAYVSANKLFVNGVRDLSQQCKKDETISECLEKCGESLQEIINYHM